MSPPSKKRAACSARMGQINFLTILKDWLSRCNQNKRKTVAPHITHLICSLVLLLTISLQLIASYSYSHSKCIPYLLFFLSSLYSYEFCCHVKEISGNFENSAGVGLVVLKKIVKAAANWPTCWPTFGTTSLTNNVGQRVGVVCYGHKHVSEEKNHQKVLANIYYFFYKCWPTWLVKDTCLRGLLYPQICWPTF